MFEKFTERARRVMSLARQESQRLNADFIGTEHILLGVIDEGGGVAAKVLKNMNVDLKRVRQEIEKPVTPSTSPTTILGQLPFSPRSKRVIELAGEAASQLGHDVIGTEHLLFGLLKENEGIAAQVLINLGLKLDEVRDMTLEVLGADVKNPPPPPPTPFAPVTATIIVDTAQNALDLEIKRLEKEMEMAFLAKEFDKASNLRDRAMKLKMEREKLSSKTLETKTSSSALSSEEKAKMIVDAWLARGGQERVPNHTEYLTQMIAWAIEASRRGA